MMMWENWCRKPKSSKKSPGKDSITLVENSKGVNVSTYQINSQRKDPRTPEAPVKMWRVQKKRQEKKWKRKKRKKKKKVKHRRHLWWTKCKEQYASFLVLERKEEDLKKKRQREE